MQVKTTLQYPFNEKYEFRTRLVRLNMTKEMEHDMEIGKGFLIKEPQALNKTLKSSDSIYSDKYMKTLQDPDAFSDKYSCECGATQGMDYAGMLCKICGKEVKFVGDDFEIFGWIKLNDPYRIIHPNLFKTLESYFGATNLAEIIEPDIDLNEDGNPMTVYDRKIYAAKIKRKYTRRSTKSDKTYAGIGIIELYNRFDEILEYFHSKNKNKKLDYYQDILDNRDKIFINAIPVYSTGLRPFKTEGGRFTFEGTNAIFNIMAKLAANINRDSLSIYRIPKYRISILWDLQDRYNALYKEVESILSGKKGNIRLLIGGRCSFTSRCIITPDPTLRMDEVKLPYHGLVELLQQTIVNILANSYNISYSNAYMIWYKAQIVPNKIVKDIILNLIRSQGGINVLVNRNPTINYGSILAMRCIGINDTYTMSMPLQVLSGLGADFDGDNLNVMYIPNKAFWESAMECFNPRNAMCISRNDGRFNNSVNLFKDILISTNGLIDLSRSKYTQEELDQIEMVKKFGN